MARPKSADTRTRIQAAALELFGEKGIQQTSLREIADRLGVTKPALYYHFDSREDLVRSLVQPLIETMEGFVADLEAAGPAEAREVLEAYFDVVYEQRHLTEVIVRDLSTLSYLDLGSRFVRWRMRIIAMLVGPEPTPAERVAAMLAIGGLSDCTVAFPDVPVDELRKASVDAAYAALGRSMA